MTESLPSPEACDLAESLSQAKYDFEMMCGPDPHPLQKIAFAAFDVAITHYERIWGHDNTCTCIDCSAAGYATLNMIEALKNG